ncbi:hypothetical protein C8Q80DRAFT_130893 [Daedaleopsis nitida]|nr:hypothetical protein C8Q80DRAFT_130893 [Daedaleopsis nitida]
MHYASLTQCSSYAPSYPLSHTQSPFSPSEPIRAVSLVRSDLLTQALTSDICDCLAITTSAPPLKVPDRLHRLLANHQTAAASSTVEPQNSSPRSASLHPHVSSIPSLADHMLSSSSNPTREQIGYIANMTVTLTLSVSSSY